MFGIGMEEMFLILMIALLLFGPGKLPEIGGYLGKGIRSFRKAVQGPDEDGSKRDSIP